MPTFAEVVGSQHNGGGCAGRAVVLSGGERGEGRQRHADVEVEPKEARAKLCLESAREKIAALRLLATCRVPQAAA